MSYSYIQNVYPNFQSSKNLGGVYNKLTIPTRPAVNEKTVENFENEEKKCDVEHLMKCEECRKVIIKQFNLEKDESLKEDILDIITHIIFAVFIILLLEKK